MDKETSDKDMLAMQDLILNLMIRTHALEKILFDKNQITEEEYKKVLEGISSKISDIVKNTAAEFLKKESSEINQKTIVDQEGK